LNLSQAAGQPGKINFMFKSTDISPFLENGVRNLLFTDGPFNEFHSFKDTPDNLDYEKMAALTELLFNVLLDVPDDAPEQM
jgi:hypothetical protein